MYLVVLQRVLQRKRLDELLWADETQSVLEGRRGESGGYGGWGDRITLEPQAQLSQFEDTEGLQMDSYRFKSSPNEITSALKRRIQHKEKQKEYSR
jgi:hypothetical protein